MHLCIVPRSCNSSIKGCSFWLFHVSPYVPAYQWSVTIFTPLVSCIYLVQLRICSCHFSGGEKKEGDVPVPDPEVDEPINIDISGATNNSNTNHSSPSRCLMDKQKRAAKRQRMSVDRIVEGGFFFLSSWVCNGIYITEGNKKDSCRQLDVCIRVVLDVHPTILLR